MRALILRAVFVLTFIPVFVAPAIAQGEIPSGTSRIEEKPRFSFWDAAELEATRREIAAGNPFFVDRYRRLISDADKLLSFEPDPVVNKPTVPPSGDKHDYLSLSPYYWPDPKAEDGLPWRFHDGRINPATRGKNTDQARQQEMMDALVPLNLAYYLSGDRKYGEKILQILRIWYIDQATRVNPSIEFTQGIPGVTHGRSNGVIEWTGIRFVVTAVELVSETGLMPAEDQLAMHKWLNRYADWLVNSPIGKGEGAARNNHGTWYDVQAMTLLIHLGRMEEARRRAEAAKTDRIASQIEPDGSMPRENNRTKSVNYNSMNREAFVHLARLAKVVGVDLVNYETDDGRSLRRALAYLLPWARGELEWPYEQIEYGGAKPAIEIRMQPVLLFAGDVLELDLLEPELAREVAHRARVINVLSFPPRVMLATESDER